MGPSSWLSTISEHLGQCPCVFDWSWPIFAEVLSSTFNGSWLRAPRRSSSAHDTRQFHLACGHLLVCMDIKLPYFSSATDHIWRVHRLRHHAHLHERSCVSCGHISAVRRKCIGSKHVREKRSCGWVSSSGTADVQIAWHIMGYERPRIPVRPTYSSTDSLL